MQKDELNPVAAHLIAAYADTFSFGRQFKDDHGTPPTRMAKVHHMLSVLTARMIADDRYELKPAYVEFGRVQVEDLTAEQHLLFRSAGTVATERVKKYPQLALIPASDLRQRSTVELVIYEFSPKGVDLSIAATTRRPRSTRLLAVGEPTYMGLWPWSTEADPEPFEQSVADVFAEVGDLAHDEASSE